MEWVSAEKKIYERKKKYTASHQKEWVSGLVIFSREIKIYGTFESTPNAARFENLLVHSVLSKSFSQILRI